MQFTYSGVVLILIIACFFLIKYLHESNDRFSHLNLSPILGQTHWKAIAQMEIHDTQHHRADSDEVNSLAASQSVQKLKNVEQTNCFLNVSFSKIQKKLLSDKWQNPINTNVNFFDKHYTKYYCD